jgi:hypothetical protein
MARNLLLSLMDAMYMNAKQVSTAVERRRY